MKPFASSVPPSLPWILALSATLLACADHPTPAERDLDAFAREDVAARLGAASRRPVTLRAEGGVIAFASLEVPVDTTDPDPVAQATQFLRTYGGLYGVTDPAAELSVVTVLVDEEGEHVVFGRRFGEVPVADDVLAVHLRRGAVVMTQGHLPPAPTVRPPVRIAADRAAGIAVRHELGVDVQATGAAELVFAGIPVVTRDGGVQRSTRLVWRVATVGADRTSGALGSWDVDVDAVTGELVRVLPTFEAAKEIRVAGAYGSGYDGLACWTFVDDVDWLDEDGPLPTYDAGWDWDGDGMFAWSLAHDTWDEHASFGWHSWKGDGSAELVAVVDANLPTTVASASDHCQTLQFRDDWVDTDIFVHEFTHQVDAASAKLAYSWLTGALDESFADIAGAHADGNWTVGELNGAFRDLSAPETYGHPDHVLPWVSADGMGLRPWSNTDNGWVHVNSGIPNKVGYLVTAGDVHNGYTIDGIGVDSARPLYHFTHVNGFFGVQSFVDARDAFVAKAEYYASQGLHGFDTFGVCDVKNAWASVGVDVDGADFDCDQKADGWDADDDGDYADDDVDNCVGLANGTQSDLDGDGFGDACDSDIDGDGKANEDDLCPAIADEVQVDGDQDGIGSQCDDSDGDGTVDLYDNCWLSNPNQADTDGDGFGDVCDSDDDGDLVYDEQDNCAGTANADQSDVDGDGVGDACDNCVDVENPDQQDCDDDKIGTACDTTYEALACDDLSLGWAEVHDWVHPLDLVSLPQLDDVIRGSQVEVTVAAGVVGVPVHLVDRAGRVVARATTGRDGIARMSVAPGSSRYAVQLPPEAGGAAGGLDVSIAVEVVQD